MRDAKDARPILDGLRIVEASAFVAAPLGGMTLAQLGADVIRIDPPGGGLDYRRWPVSADGTSLFWCGLNKQKRSVAIDVARPEGRELAAALICAPGEGGGILLTNLPPRGYLSYDSLRRERPDLIQLTLSGDRHGGSAVDYTINPRVGLPYLTGEGAPEAAVNHVLPAWDLVTGHMAAVGLLAAERHRHRSGEGQQVQLALEDMALAMIGHLGFLAEAQLGQQRERVGNDLYGAFGRDFVSADGMRIMVVGLTPKQWAALVAATGLRREMAELGARLDTDLEREGERFRAREAIAALLATWIGRRGLRDIAAAFDRHGVCWSRYQTMAQLLRDDPSCSLANPLFSQVSQPGVGELLAPGMPLAFSAFERRPAGAAPQLGQHTEQVLLDVLGMPGAEFGRLLERGIVACACPEAA
ncbi:MAG: CoA transferase [Pseudomonadota bacterium]